ncbi:MAG: ABC transporter substrate-binding protein [Burkholderiales bacterium]
MMTDRRGFLLAASAAAAGLAAPGVLRAQAAEPVRIGALLPLTGGGGQYGPTMAKVAQLVADEVNAAGGLLGRKLELIIEDDQTNPESGTRAARKLIDVNRVGAIAGAWASSVASAVAPLCWESKTFLATCAGADSITRLPHQGYIIRTQPTSGFQGVKIGRYVAELGGRRVAYLGLQTPFTPFTVEGVTTALKAVGGTVEAVIYEPKKPGYRTELDKALASNPDTLMMGGFLDDTTVLARDIFRAGFKGRLIGFGYTVNQKLIDALPPGSIEGAYGVSGSAAIDGTAYKRLAGKLAQESVDPFAAQIYDQMNLLLLAIAQTKQSTGASIKEGIRAVSQSGRKVDNAIDGIKAIAAGQAIQYDGASGPCRFTDIGDIVDGPFRYEQVKEGKIALLKIA